MVVGVIGANGLHVVALVDLERLRDQEHVQTHDLLYLEIIVLVIQLSMLPAKLHHAQVSISSVNLCIFLLVCQIIILYFINQ